MASPFAEAITQSMIAGLDPMNGVIKQYAGQQVSRAELDLDIERNKFTLELQKQIDDGKANGVDGNVIVAWQRVLNKHTQ